MTGRIYFDNAATSFPKPESVYQAVDHYGRDIGASAGRGVYAEAIESGDIIEQTRRAIAKLINAANHNSIIMTFNCTDGLSLAIKGIINQPGGHVITTRMDHNSVLRPLCELQRRIGIDVTFVPADSFGMVDPEDIRRAVRPNTKLIATVHGSNVCGSMQDIAAIGRIAQEHQIPFLLDAAQTVGHVPMDVQAFNVDMLAFPGHKALLGPLGTGALYIRPGFESKLQTLKEGGTGSKSELPFQPDFMPDRFEAGSHNAIGIAGLLAGVQYLLEKGVHNHRKHEEQMCKVFLDAAEAIPNLKLYGPKNIDQRLGVFSVTIEPYKPAELSAILEQQFGLLTRPGLHCAPYAHETLGTLKLNGTTRFSTGPFLTIEDCSYAVSALKQIAQAAAAV